MAFYFMPPDMNMREELARHEERRSQEEMPNLLRDKGFRREAEEANRVSRGRRTTRTLLLVGGVVLLALLAVLYLHVR